MKSLFAKALKNMCEKIDIILHSTLFILHCKLKFDQIITEIIFKSVSLDSKFDFLKIEQFKGTIIIDSLNALT